MKIRENRKLRVELARRGMTQAELSANTKIPSSLISMGINGRYLFDDDQKSRIAQSLNTMEKDIFD